VQAPSVAAAAAAGAAGVQAAAAAAAQLPPTPAAHDVSAAGGPHVASLPPNQAPLSSQR
jgi:hypothetical protein